MWLEKIFHWWWYTSPMAGGKLWGHWPTTPDGTVWATPLSLQLGVWFSIVLVTVLTCMVFWPDARTEDDLDHESATGIFGVLALVFGCFWPFFVTVIYSVIPIVALLVFVGYASYQVARFGQVLRDMRKARIHKKRALLAEMEDTEKQMSEWGLSNTRPVLTGPVSGQPTMMVKHRPSSPSSFDMYWS